MVAELALGDEAIALRRWSMDDLACVAEASTDARISVWTTVPDAYTDAAGRAFVERQWSRADSGDGVSLAIHSRAAGRAVGLVAIMRRPQLGVVGLGYWIVPSARRAGMASRAATLASSWALEDGGFSRVETWVEPDNVASQSVLERAGFTREGLLRSFLPSGSTRSDMYVYSRIADRPAADPKGSLRAPPGNMEA